MTIILVGLNHRSAPVELREKLGQSEHSLESAREKLGGGHSQEAAVLSTCNRFEVYAVVDQRDTGWQSLDRLVADLLDTSLDAISPHLYHYEGMYAARHLMRVAAGLDSMILGEPQILGQVAQAFSDAQSAELVGPVLSHLFSQALHAGKRARSETDISRFTTSVSHAGVLLLLDHMTVSTPNVLIVGAGDMAVLAAKALRQHPGSNLAFINRSASHAEAAASDLGENTLSWHWHEFADALTWADALISATAAPHPILYARDVERVMPQRQGRPLVCVDIAVPRDVEVAVGQIEGVQRYDIDDLHSIVDNNTAQREAAVPQVEAIIEQELNRFSEWYYSREVSAVIKDLRQWASEVARLEVDQALNKLPDVDAHTEQVVNRLAHRLVNKLLHEPTVQLRGQAAEGNGYVYAHMVSELFDLQSSMKDWTSGD